MATESKQDVAVTSTKGHTAPHALGNIPKPPTVL